MKKTLVALSVLAAASAQAGIELYNQDGVSVSLKGDIEVQYANSFESSSMKQEIEDADFGFDVRYAVNDEVSVGGYWEFDGSTSSNASNAEAGDTYVAVYTQTYGSLKFGRLCTAIDDAGIGSDEVFGLKSFFSDSSACEDEGVRYDYDNGSFYATLGLLQDKHASNSLNEDSNYYDGRLGFRVADFDVSGFFAQGDVDKTVKNSSDVTVAELITDDSLLALELVYSGVENVTLEAAYYTTEQEVTKVSGVNTLGSIVGDKLEADTWAVAAGYTMGLYGFNAGYSSTDRTSTADRFTVKDQTNWFANVTYAVAPSAKLYMEFAGQDVDGSDNDNAFAIGAEASF
ncbi:porin [Vibrio europaeus]|uniref:porin n=1 Tax=Vibrio europaeus TaxID=300876 RepID=UPI00148D3C0C|nr:porin [Vibrio europaeus]NOH23562.1 porin [Vibrio europaeus]